MLMVVGAQVRWDDTLWHDFTVSRGLQFHRQNQVSHTIHNDLGFSAFKIVGHSIDFENQLSYLCLHTAAYLPRPRFLAEPRNNSGQPKKTATNGASNTCSASL